MHHPRTKGKSNRWLAGVAKIQHARWQSVFLAAVEPGESSQPQLRRPIRLGRRGPFGEEANGQLRGKGPLENVAEWLQLEGSCQAVHVTPDEQMRRGFEHSPVQFDSQSGC